MKTLLKLVVGALLIVGGVMAVSYLQYRFDRSDVKHALNAVRATRTLGADDATIEEKLSQKFSVQPQKIQWKPTIKSKTRGTVEIEAQIPGSSDQFLWMVDLIRFNVIPVSPAAIALGKGS